MTTIVTRAGKGSALSYVEMDANFTNLNTAKLESSDLAAYETSAHASSTYATQTTVAANAAAALQKSANLSDVANVSTARSNLGVSATGADATYNVKSANLSDVANVSTARSNLGLGTAATASASSFAASGATTSSGLTMATGKLLGRSTASTGAIEEITLGSGLSLAGGTLSVSAAGITLGTAVATTSGTSIDFTSIPSTAKRITVMLNSVSTSGTSLMQLQIGAGSVDTTGYLGAASFITNSGAVGTEAAMRTSGIPIQSSNAAADAWTAAVIFNTLGSNVWNVHGGTTRTSSPGSGTCGGTKTLSGSLDRIRLTTVNGTDTFDAGSINISWE